MSYKTKEELIELAQNAESEKKRIFKKIEDLKIEVKELKNRHGITDIEAEIKDLKNSFDAIAHNTVSEISKADQGELDFTENE